MKKILLLISALLISSTALSEIDKEKYCRGRIKMETRYSEWGKELQKDMLQTCKQKDVNNCMDAYIEKIKDSEARDMRAFREYLNNNQESNEVARILTITSIGEAHIAAMIALKTTKSVDRIVNDKYIECLAVK